MILLLSFPLYFLVASGIKYCKINSVAELFLSKLRTKIIKIKQLQKYKKDQLYNFFNHRKFFAQSCMIVFKNSCLSQYFAIVYWQILKITPCATVAKHKVQTVLILGLLFNVLYFKKCCTSVQERPGGLELLQQI